MGPDPARWRADHHWMLAERYGLIDALRFVIEDGLPTLGTCAGIRFQHGTFRQLQEERKILQSRAAQPRLAHARVLRAWTSETALPAFLSFLAWRFCLRSWAAAVLLCSPPLSLLAIGASRRGACHVSQHPQTAL